MGILSDRRISLRKNEAQNCVLSDFIFSGRFIGPPLFFVKTAKSVFLSL